MNITLFVTQETMQINFQPQNDSEKELCRMISKYKGAVNFSGAIDIKMTQGNYLRNFGELPETFAITFSKTETE